MKIPVNITDSKNRQIPVNPAVVNQQLATRGALSSVGQIVLTFIAWFARTDIGLFHESRLFFVGLFAANFARFFLARRVKTFPTLRWNRLYAAVTLSTALLWSALTTDVLLRLGLEGDTDDLFMILSAGIAAAGTAALSPERKLARGFVFCLLLPISVTLGFLMPAHHWSLAGVSVAFFFLLWNLIDVQANFLLDLQEQRDRFEALTDASMEAVVIHIDGQIIQANPAACRLFGYESTDLVGGHLAQLVPEEDWDLLQQRVAERSSDAIPWRAKRSDGSIFPVEAIGKTFFYRGRMARVTCIQDMTARRRAEEAIKESARQAQMVVEARERAAIESGRLKAEFLANMSHEIRTPLNAIIGITDLLKDLPATDQQKSYVRAMRDSGEALLGLVNDILDYSKLENGAVELESLTFELNAVVDGQVNLLATKALQKRIALRSFVDPALPKSVRGDHGRIGQILLNLVGNAIKFTDSGSIAVHALRARREGINQFVRFEVRDTGPGISVEAGSRLFRPFTQADSSTARKHGGTGLGLSICRKLVEAMGGEISFKSRLGEGTTFWFEIPLEVMSERSIGESLDRSVTKALRVAVLDEGLPSGEVILAYLRAWGIESESISLRAVSASPAEILICSRRTLENVRAVTARKSPSSPRLVSVAEFLEDRGDLPRATNPDVLGSLSAPVRPSDLFNVLAASLRESPSAVTAPVARPALNAHAPTATVETLVPATAAGDTAQILVAEDNSTNQLIILALLRQFGLSCHAVGNGAEAVEAYNVGRYDLILMDCQMPEMDGFEATERIRKLEENGRRRTPIVALTANVFKEDRERCFAAGMDDFLSKPVRREKLVAALKSLLGDKMAA